MSKKGNSSLKPIKYREPTIKQILREQGKVKWTTWQVTYYEKNKRFRKQFKDESKAKNFMNLKDVELLNHSALQHNVTTSLNPDLVKIAERAFERLGDTYTMDQAIDYFLENHRAPNHKTTLKNSIATYLDFCEHSGNRPVTIKSKISVLNQFLEYMGEIYTHEVTTEKITSYLKRLRARGGVEKASRKTWNNYRNDLSYFFKWASEKDISTNRPHIFMNPVEGVLLYSAKQVTDQRGRTIVTPAKKIPRRLSALMNWHDGALVKYFAIMYFAGIRSGGELRKLAKLEKELIDLKTRIIHIPADVSKGKEERKVTISDNLHKWLTAYADKPILPKNHDRLIKRAREAFKLTRNEARHSFISYHVALHRSIGDASLEAGNSETMVKKHYYNLRPAEEGSMFFSIIPDMESRKAVLSDQPAESNARLKAI